MQSAPWDTTSLVVGQPQNFTGAGVAEMPEVLVPLTTAVPMAVRSTSPMPHRIKRTGFRRGLDL